MSNHARTLAAAIFCSGSIAVMPGAASAMPVAHGLALQNAVPSQVEAARWGGGGWGGRGWGGRGWGGRGWGWGGFAAGAIIGGALAAPYYYGGYYGGYYPAPYYPAYSAPGYYGGGPAEGGDVDYCMQRYHSYDPRTGTFLGFDGARHPCP
jgi:hypothetical protein